MDYLQTTRGRILASIKQHGQSHPDQIAPELGLASTSVRQHLNVLQRDGYVSVHEVREGTGRPRLVYRVTRTGDALFHKRYDAFATGVLMAAVRSGSAPEILDAYVEDQVAARKGRVRGFDTRSRMREVAAVMQEDGGMAHVIEDDRSVAIREPNCVLAAIAAVDPAVCEAHVQLVQRLLAVPVTFNRTSDPYTGGCTWTAAVTAAGVDRLNGAAS
ncbi:MAG: helix-turn-helix transcriptional regulator [Tepidiformaceae bacterium]